MRSECIVAIDGPAGAGKSTAARNVAELLGYVLLDTGSLYRAVAYYAQTHAGLDFDDRDSIEHLACDIVALGELRIGRNGSATRVLIWGQDPGAALRTPEISMAASKISAYPGVRLALLDLQRSFGVEGGVVAEGRDIGTVVFPDAEVKIFLTASAQTRAQRRWEELLTRGEATTSLEEVLADVIQRDTQDSTRAIAPLRRAPDAIEIDSSHTTPEQVTMAIVEAVARWKMEHRP